MASVPTWQPSVTVQQAPSVRVSAPMGDMGAPVFAGIDKLEAAGKKYQADSDAYAVVNASNAMTMDMLNYFNGENGLFAKKGADAMGASQQAQQFFTDSVQKYSSTLQNDAQRRMFEAHMKPNAYNYLRDAATHERNEISSFQNQQYNSGISLGVQGAALNYKDPNSLQGFLDSNERLLQTQAKAQGWSPDTVTLHRINNNTNAVKNAYLSAIDNNDYSSAKNLLDKFGPMIDPVTKNKLSENIRQHQQKNDDFLAADSIVKQATRSDGSIDMAIAQNLLNKMYGPGSGTSIGGNAIIQEGSKQIGKPYLLGADGVSSTDCGLFTQQVLQNATGFDIGTRTADGQYLALQKQGKVFNDASGLQKGDLVFWDVPSNHSHWSPSDDPSAVNSDSEAYKGITHVGLYAGDGKVLQAGSNGVDYMDINTYPVVGYGKTGGDDNQSAAFDAGRYKQVEGIVHASIADNMRIKAQQDRDYRQQLSQQIDGAGSLSDAMDVINSAELPLQTKNALIGAAKSKFKALATGDPDKKHYAYYERNGLYRDLNVTAEQQAMIEEGRDPTPAQSTKFSNAWYRINRYNAFVNGGGYGGSESGGDSGDTDVAKNRYQEILQDLWNSKTPEERKQKVRDNMNELNSLEQQLGVDANNDVSYIMANGETPPQAQEEVSPDDYNYSQGGD